MTATGLSDLRARHPEWMPWLSVVEMTLHEIRDPAWQQGLPSVPYEASSERQDTCASRLSRCNARPDPARLKDLLDRLIRVALTTQAPSLGALRHARYDAGDSLAIFIASVQGDEERLHALATHMHAEPAPLRAIASLLPLPWLQAFRRQQAANMPRGWRVGYCPCCGSWPSLASICGVERIRYLGCGRCGHSWEAEGLKCPYCGMRDHDRLGSLLPDDGTGQGAIEVCKACNGYVKALRVLGPNKPEDALIVDLSSVEFDLVATMRGYRRPPGTGCRIHWED